MTALIPQPQPLTPTDLRDTARFLLAEASVVYVPNDTSLYNALSRTAAHLFDRASLLEAKAVG